ncbi:hypothetical protein [Streptomyces chartreusis]|uniref:hypothetical protein n=1 Tax=Streptomyces chartreusis TaxID=1969 RepID=UPI0037B70289
MEVPDEMVDGSIWDELTDEARGFIPSVKRFADDRPGHRFYRDGTMQSPQRCGAHSGGPALKALATGRLLREIAAESTGSTTLVPVRFGYKYYSSGDFLGIHRDNIRCTITFTFGLTDNLGEMGWLRGCRDMNNDELREHLKSSGLFPETSEAMPVNEREMRGFDGHNIPHWRVPFEGELGILGTVCFFDL